jgi:hypothetical protein
MCVCAYLEKKEEVFGYVFESLGAFHEEGLCHLHEGDKEDGG